MTSKAKPGDLVKVTTSSETIEGILLPRPALLKPHIMVLKLDNGYNIGIEEHKIKSMSVVKAHTAKKVAARKQPHDPQLPTVAILSFGGTISSRVDYTTGGVVADYDANDFLAMCPELATIANMRARKVAQMMSEDMAPEDWLLMARTIKEELDNDEISGIVITHGTDTLHYSTAAMSFMLQNLNKPVIFTASQRSIDRGSSDAFMNLSCAVTAAARWDGAVVATCMHGTSNDDYCLLLRGSTVRKMHTSRRDAFRPINDRPLAKVYPNGTIEASGAPYRKRSVDKPTLMAGFAKTGMLMVYPGIDPKLLDHFIKNKYKGLVISATALGHVPTVRKEHSLLPKIKEAVAAGILVVIASQTIYGNPHPYVYANLRKLSVEAGCAYIETLTPEATYVKLGWALAHAASVREAQQLLLADLDDDFDGRSMPETFLS